MLAVVLVVAVVAIASVVVGSKLSMTSPRRRGAPRPWTTSDTPVSYDDSAGERHHHHHGGHDVDTGSHHVDIGSHHADSGSHHSRVTRSPRERG